MAEPANDALQPLVFEPLFMERIWGGRRLEALFGKRLPPGVAIGESWELVDRAEAQSIVAAGPWRGRSLHELWLQHRAEVFGEMADAPRFPLFIKLLDASEKLSVQVHPPPHAAEELGGEPKSEFWYVAEAAPAAELYVGLKKGSSRAALAQALESGTVEEHLHRLPVRAGDAMFLPSGRMHAIGACNLIVEIQQNSDTTYRVFDWNRTDTGGAPRDLHIDESMQSIDFEDFEPELVSPAGEVLLAHDLFCIERWNLEQPRHIAERGTFGVVMCLTGEAECAEVRLKAGELLLLPADAAHRVLRPRVDGTSVLRVTQGSGGAGR
ncbi:MAG: class I mannose-6-phosphate isomerase [Verrucomicrobiota bacterium]|nr:class I mannose-6-phosphate isomerase [Verrucomicrobiota bacterium]